MNFINNIVKKLFAPLVAIIISFSVITDVSALEADITGNINPAVTDIPVSLIRQEQQYLI